MAHYRGAHVWVFSKYPNMGPTVRSLTNTYILGTFPRAKNLLFTANLQEIGCGTIQGFEKRLSVYPHGQDPNQKRQ